MVDVTGIIVSALSVVSGTGALLNQVMKAIKYFKSRKNKKQLQSSENQKVLAALKDIYKDLNFYKDIVREYDPQTEQGIYNILGSEMDNHLEFEKQMTALGEDLNFFCGEIEKLLDASSTPDLKKVEEIRKEIDRSFKAHLLKSLMMLQKTVKILEASISSRDDQRNKSRPLNQFNVVINIQNLNIINGADQQFIQSVLFEFAQSVTSNVNKIAHYNTVLRQPAVDDNSSYELIDHHYNVEENYELDLRERIAATHGSPIRDVGCLSQQITHLKLAAEHRQLTALPNTNLELEDKIINIADSTNDIYNIYTVLKYKGSSGEKEGREVSALMGNRSIFHDLDLRSEMHQIDKKAMNRDVIFYMEVELVQSIEGPDGWAGVGIGLVASPETHFRPDKMPGWYKNSLGYDGRLGKVYSTSAGNTLLQNCGLLREKGDKAALGVRLIHRGGSHDGRDVDPELFLELKDGFEVTKATERDGRQPFFEAWKLRGGRKSWLALDVRPVIGLGSAGAAKIRLRLRSSSEYLDWFRQVDDRWETSLFEY